MYSILVTLLVKLMNQILVLENFGACPFNSYHI